jgi:hypothetical protein
MPHPFYRRCTPDLNWSGRASFEEIRVLKASLRSDAMSKN